MQPAFFSNVRANLARSPTSPTSTSSSIRSLSPSRRSPHLRSRSSSPSPRRFASVLAYQPTPPLEGNSQRKASADDQILQQLQPQKRQQQQKPQQRQLDSHDPEAVLRSSNSKGSRDRDESPSRIAFRNLEESWRRFELDSTPTSPLLSAANSTLGSPVSRPASPSPLSRPPYKELVECASLSEVKEAAPDGHSRGTGEFSRLSDPISKSSKGKASNGDTYTNDSLTKATTAVTSFTPESPLLSESTPTAPTSSSPAARVSAQTVPTKAGDDSLLQPAQAQSSTFLVSDEMRHILDLPSLLGQDPSTIPKVLATPIPPQPTRHNVGRASPANTASGGSVPAGGSDSTVQRSLSDVNTKAQKTAKAMTKRYAAKNLNMTETEAHRMVQLMAAEIVSLHEEREVMMQKMEQAKQEMLEAARLLRMKAAVVQAEPEEMHDMSAEGQQRRSHATLSEHDESMRRRQGPDVEEEERERNRQGASHYDRDEWKR